jgi:malonyl-CoA O-methyltransferase
MREVAVPDKRAVRRSFERAAATYDRNAVLHREVAARLIEHLDPIKIAPARVVDLGCGTGGAFHALGERFPRAELIGIDIARPMLLRAADRSPWWRRAFAAQPRRLVCADAERLPLASSSSQLLFSNLLLQWCAPEPVFAEAARVLAVGGLFMFSTFGPDTLAELRAAFAAADGAPHVHSFVDMHDLGDALVHAGFADPVMEMERITLEYSSVEAIARDLRSVGAGNALGARPRGLMGRARWKRAAGDYERHRHGGILPATYEVVYGHAWKTAPRRSADGRQVIDFRTREAR